MDGNTVVVGASSEASNGSGPGDNSANAAGAAYVFVRSGGTWSQQAYLKASNAEENDYFGTSVSISGDTIVVGAPRESSDGTSQTNNNMLYSGAAYVFVRSGTTWTQQAYLKSDTPGYFDSFGQAVDVQGDTLVVGAYYESSIQSGSGAVYVFVGSGANWTSNT